MPPIPGRGLAAAGLCIGRAYCQQLRISRAVRNLVDNTEFQWLPQNFSKKQRLQPSANQTVARSRHWCLSVPGLDSSGLQTRSSHTLAPAQHSTAASAQHNVEAEIRASLGPIDLTCPTYVIWGSNTGVGKTLVSAGLSATFLTGAMQEAPSTYARRPSGDNAELDPPNRAAAPQVLYVKPVQTGFPEDSDSRFVCQQVARLVERQLGSQARSHCPVRFLYEAPDGDASWHAVLRLMADESIDQPAVSPTPALALPSGGLPRIPWAPSGAASLDRGVSGRRKVSGASESLWMDLGAPDDTRNAAVLGPREAPPAPALGGAGSWLRCKTLWAWREAASPHLTAAREGGMVDDQQLGIALQSLLWEDSCHGQASALSQGVAGEEGLSQDSEGHGRAASSWRLRLVETAGGVASPAPSGSLQGDVYRQLRLPGILVGDGRLGGISATISAYESLLLRGQDTAAVVLLDGGLQNEEAIQGHLPPGVPVFVLPPLPPHAPSTPAPDLLDWFTQSQPVFRQLASALERGHEARTRRLGDMRALAQRLLWWPFTQHGLVGDADVTVIDSRCGANFAVWQDSSRSLPGGGPPGGVISQQTDACASWWTQGPSASLQAELARSVAYAGARYGHVMFPQNVHEPALRCAELLLAGPGAGWAERVFFSDNGSTAIEVAIKMAFRKYSLDHALHEDLPGVQRPQLQVVALAGSYHGDTLGAMEAQAPSAYTGFLQQPWYRGLGLFLVPPRLDCRQGRWQVQLPPSYLELARALPQIPAADLQFASRDAAFDTGRDTSQVAEVYRAFVSSQLAAAHGAKQGAVPAALIIEPVIHGAGGMEMVDPLFQRILVQECRLRGIPVIFDEVFVGCWRLGVESARQLLACDPDIACYAKLLTGGVVPLAVTLASGSIFNSFLGDSKLSALLHGHSYTAHTAGCAAAVTALQRFRDPGANPNYILAAGRLREVWDPALVARLSCHPAVERVLALGSVFALELKAEDGAGYCSMAARGVVEGLQEDGVFARPLGNVVYLMCGPMTPPSECTTLLRKLERQLA